MFTVGRTYRRRQDLHAVYGGQQQGGISTPTGSPMVFLFTGDAGEAYGYADAFQPDGTFWYTGEGQVGDMQMVRGNRAIEQHAAEGKALHLFEYIAKGLVRYVGEANYLGHHLEPRPDVGGNTRQAIVFELEIDAAPAAKASPAPARPLPSKSLWSMSMKDLWSRTVSKPPKSAPTSTRRQVTRLRCEAVRIYVLRRADGICEGCGSRAPFVRKDGRPYLEPHHVNRLADGGPDHPAFVAAVCPTCHRRVHHAKDGKTYNEMIIKRLRAIEPAP